MSELPTNPEGGDPASAVDATRKPRPAVWEVYDALRTARLNQYYFTERLGTVSNKNRRLEIAVAIATPTSGVATLAVWDSTYGKVAWGAIALVAATLAVSKPFLNWSERAQVYQQLATRYRSIATDLETLSEDIRARGHYDDELRRTYRVIQANKRKLSDDEPIEPIDETLRRSMFDRVNAELPATDFFAPED